MNKNQLNTLAIEYHDHLLDALRELVAEFDAADAAESEKPGCWGLPETTGMAWAKLVLRRYDREVEEVSRR